MNIFCVRLQLNIYKWINYINFVYINNEEKISVWTFLEDSKKVRDSPLALICCKQPMPFFPSEEESLCLFGL